MVNTLENESIPAQLVGKDLIFFDGECVLCDGLVQKLIKMDRHKHFLLGALQSDIARLILGRHQIDTCSLNSVYVVANCATDREEVLSKSQAVIYVLLQLPNYSILGSMLSIFPRFLRDFGYSCVARTRYKIFGKKEKAICSLPTPEDRDRLIS